MDFIVLAKQALALGETISIEEIKKMMYHHPAPNTDIQKDEISLIVCCLENTYASYRFCKKRRVPRFINGEHAGWRDGIIDESYNPLDPQLIKNVQFHLMILTLYSIYNNGIDFTMLDPSMPVNYYCRIISDLNPYFDFVFTGTWSDLNLQRILRFSSF